MNWISINKPSIPDGYLKVRDIHNREAFVYSASGIMEIITDATDNPLLDRITHYRMLKECSLKLFSHYIDQNLLLAS